MGDDLEKAQLRVRVSKFKKALEEIKEASMEKNDNEAAENAECEENGGGPYDAKNDLDTVHELATDALDELEDL